MEKIHRLSDLLQILIEKGIKASLHGDPDFEIKKVATLQDAQKNELSFLNNPLYKRYLKHSNAGALLLTQQDLGDWDKNALLVEKKALHLAWAYIVEQFCNAPQASANIHPSAVIAESARIGKHVSIGAYTVIGEDVIIGDHVIIGAHSIIEDHVKIGTYCHLHARSTVLYGCELGQRVILHSGCIIGSDGFGFAASDHGYVKVAQLGKVIIRDDADIGANTTIDRGALSDTIIGQGVKLDNQIQIAHNVEVGEHTVIASCTGISGSTKIGKNCMIGGGVGFAGHITITDNVVLTGFSMVTHSIHNAGIYSSGLPVMENQKWRHLIGRLKRIDKLHERLSVLEEINQNNTTKSSTGEDA